MHILYRDSSLESLERLTKSGSSWSTATELDAGVAVGLEHAALQLSTGSACISLQQLIVVCNGMMSSHSALLTLSIPSGL